MTTSSGHTHHVTYPVEKSHFYFDPKKRSETRQKLGLKDDDFVFLYAGRLSRQKSVVELVSIFAQWSENVAPNAYLYLAGDFDDLGVPYLSKRDEFNQYFTEYQNLVSNLAPEIQKRIKYLGNFSHDELPYLYNSADTYISLSVHNDEDFGMAPAEAACCGLPMILTDWGGYSSFKIQQTDSCDLVPVKIGRSNIQFDPEVVGKLLFKKLVQPASLETRKQTSHEYSQVLSIQAVAQNMNKILSEKPPVFEGFSELFMEVADKATMGNHGLFSKVTVEFNQLYRTLYDSYV